MKRLLLLFILASALSLCLGVTIIHVPPTGFVADTDAELLIEVTQSDEDVAEIFVQYRVIGTEPWIPEPMKQEGEGSVYWRGIIPRTVLVMQEVEYYFEIKHSSGQSTLVPPDDGLTPRYILKPKAPEGKHTEGFVLLSDEPVITTDDGYVLAVGFMSIAEQLDPGSITLWVDGKDVTKQALTSGSTIVYREDKPRAGTRKAMIVGKMAGKDVYSDTWETQVNQGSRRKALPFTLRGSANFASNVYGVSDKDLAFGNNENDAATWMDLYGTYGVMDVRTNLYISTLESKDRQPVNRYTFGLQLPSLDIFAGDYSPTMGQYTISNKNIRGVYAHLYTKYLSIAMVQGESMRKIAIDEDPVNNIGYSGTFRQEAIGGRIALGNEDGMRLGLSFSRHRDLRSSLDKKYWWQEDDPATTDTDESLYLVKAQDNAVVSLDARLSTMDNNLIMGLEAAGSILNKNTLTGVFTADEISDYVDMDLPVDPADFEDLFVINKNMEPFLPSRANLAWNAYVRAYVLKNLINVQYSEAGSAFNALGTYGQLLDAKMLTITDQISFGRWLFIAGGLSLTEDNLMEHKSETNKYQNIYGQVLLRLPLMPYLKASYQSNKGENEDNPDIISVFEPYLRQSQNMTFGIGYNFVQIPFVPSQLDISYRMGDDNSEKSSLMVTDNLMNGLNFTINNRFETIPLRTQINYSQNKNTNQLDPANLQEVTNSNIFLRADYALWANRIKPYICIRNTSLKGDQDPQSFNYFTFGVESYPIKNMTVTTDLISKFYKNDNDSSKDYDSFTWRFMLTHRF